MSIKIYIEGGGDTDLLRSELRKGFQSLFEKAGFKGRLPKVIACGSRNDAFNDFKTALKNQKANEIILLLVDSECAIANSPPNTKWNHVLTRDEWAKPSVASEDNIYFMVECMESWFLADVSALTTFYGSNFNTTAIPRTAPLESTAKLAIYSRLESATRSTQKGIYGKGKHSFKILGSLDAAKARVHGKYSQEFFDYLDKNL